MDALRKGAPPGALPGPDLSDGDYAAIARIVEAETGISLPASKRSLVHGRLARRLRQLGMKDFSQYIALLNSPGSATERRALISAITTNVTGFFREAHHFDHLGQTALAERIAANRVARRLRIWSAACSTGEEVYSIALTALTAAPELKGWDCRILGTDIDPAVVERASLGRYPAHVLQAIPAAQRALLEGRTDVAGQVHMPANVRAMTTFRQLNLMKNWPFKGKFDIIFCRNVAIYFDKPTQARLWARLAQHLPAGGYLYIGHSERLDAGTAPLFEACALTTYRRLPDPSTERSDPWP